MYAAMIKKVNLMLSSHSGYTCSMHLGTWPELGTIRLLEEWFKLLGHSVHTTVSLLCFVWRHVGPLLYLLMPLISYEGTQKDVHWIQGNLFDDILRRYTKEHNIVPRRSHQSLPP